MSETTHTLITPLSREHFEAVVDLRRSAFDNELDVALGRSYASAFVDEVCKSRHSICLVALEGERVVGYALGIANDAVTDIRNALAPRVMRSLLLRPWAILNRTVRARLRQRIAEELRPVRAPNTSIALAEPCILLLSIAVDPAVRRNGVGHSLLKTFEGSARQRNFRSATLSTGVTNTTAVAFYQNLGWEKVASGAADYQSFYRDLMN